MIGAAYPAGQDDEPCPLSGPRRHHPQSARSCGPRPLDRARLRRRAGQPHWPRRAGPSSPHARRGGTAPVFDYRRASPSAEPPRMSDEAPRGGPRHGWRGAGKIRHATLPRSCCRLLPRPRPDPLRPTSVTITHSARYSLDNAVYQVMYEARTTDRPAAIRWSALRLIGLTLTYTERKRVAGRPAALTARHTWRDHSFNDMTNPAPIDRPAASSARCSERVSLGEIEADRRPDHHDPHSVLSARHPGTERRDPLSTCWPPPSEVVAGRRQPRCPQFTTSTRALLSSRPPCRANRARLRISTRTRHDRLVPHLAGDDSTRP